MSANANLVQRPQSSVLALRILVVDDELSVREFMTSYLRTEGHIVTTASDGVEALTILSKSPWDLIITDRNMPNMGGVELAEKIKTRHPAMRIILITGTAWASAEEPHFDRVLRKPFRLHALSAAISAVFADGQ